MLTKRQLIEWLEKSDIPDNTPVVRGDVEYDSVELYPGDVTINPAPIRVWGNDGYTSRFGPHIVID